MYNLYKYAGEPITQISPYRLPGRAELKRFHPGRKKLMCHFGNPFSDIRLYKEAKGNYRIIYVKDEDEKIIHYSYVIPYLKRFAFAKKGDMIITNSWTSKEYRNDKVFAFALRYILKRYGSEQRQVYALFGINSKYLKNELNEIDFQPYKKVKKSVLGTYKVLR